MSNLVRVRVTVQGTRPLLQHKFGPESLPLEKGEKTGVAGNDPQEWRKTCMVTKERQLFILPTYVFSCMRKGAVHTKKGRGSIQTLVQSTLQVTDAIILLDRWLPDGEPQHNAYQELVYIDVCGVRNPSTKARNVRYRLAASAGWKATFAILCDKTVVAREQMRSVARDAGILGGLGDGVTVGFGRFEVIAWEELSDAEKSPASGSVVEDKGTNLATGREKVLAVQGNGVPE